MNHALRKTPPREPPGLSGPRTLLQGRKPSGRHDIIRRGSDPGAAQTTRLKNRREWPLPCAGAPLGRPRAGQPGGRAGTREAERGRGPGAARPGSERARAGAVPAAVPPLAGAPGLSHPARDAPPAPSHMTPPPPQTFSSPSCRGSKGMENGGLGAEFPGGAAAAAIAAARGAGARGRHDALGAHQAGGEVRRG